VRQLQMAGQQVYRHAVARMTEAAQQVLAPQRREHRRRRLLRRAPANARIVGRGRRRARRAAREGLVQRRVDRQHSAASIPLGLAAAERDGLLAPGSLVGMVAFGAGFVWAAGLASWKDTVTQPQRST